MENPLTVVKLTGGKGGDKSTEVLRCDNVLGVKMHSGDKVHWGMGVGGGGKG